MNLKNTAVVGLAVMLMLASSIFVSAQGVSGPAVTTASTPIFLFPDASRTPLATLPADTSIIVLDRQGDWYLVEFRDRVYGDRRGYAAVASIRLDARRPEPSLPPLPPGTPRAGAQRARQAKPSRLVERGFVSVSGGLQTTSRTFATASTFTTFAETGTIQSTYTGSDPLVLDVAAGIGVWHGLGLGVAVTRASKPVGDAISAAVPHPFFFDRDRTVVGLAPDLTRQEIAVHLDASWTFALGRSSRLVVFGGPSHFDVTQRLVTDVAVAESYPYDTATFVSATTVDRKESGVGFNAGFDVTRLLTRGMGVGVVGRASRASLTFPLEDGQNTTIKVGGFQIGGGIRIHF